MRYIHKNRDMIDSCFILLIIGAATGIVCTLNLNFQQIEQYSSVFVSTLVIPDDVVQYFIQQTLINGFLCSVIAFLGFSVLGIPLIQLAVFIKGFQTGFQASMFLLTYKTQGILGILMTLVPQILFDLAAVIVISIASIKLSGRLISMIHESNVQYTFMNLLSHLMSDLLISLSFVLISSFIKSTLGLILVRWFTQIV